jgi:hypothetical protein
MTYLERRIGPSALIRYLYALDVATAVGGFSSSGEWQVVVWSAGKQSVHRIEQGDALALLSGARDAKGWDSVSAAKPSVPEAP